MADSLTPADFVARLAAAPGPVVDVRTPDEYAGGHLAGADNLDLMAPDFRERAAGLPTGGPVYLYCRSGNRSGQAAVVLRELGYEAYNVGGYEELADAGFATGQ